MKKSLIPSFISWDKQGQTVTGIVKSVTDLTGSKFDNPCKRYVLQTDEGLKSCLLGSVTDEKLQGCDIIGMRLEIVYKGKLKLEKGRSMNNFEINEIEDE